MSEYYLFAIFAFALIAVLILFAKFLFASRKKPEDIEIREEKLLRLYRQIEDMMESFEEYAEEVKQDITEMSDGVVSKLSDFEKHIDEKVKNEIDAKTKSFEKPMFQEITAENVIKPAKADPKSEPKEEKNEKKNEKKPDIPKSAQAEQLEKLKKEREEKIAQEKEKAEKPKEETKSETVVRLYDEGNDANSIAKEMNMTTAEIKLILQMYSRDV